MADLISILNEGIESIKHNPIPQLTPIIESQLKGDDIDEV